MPNVQEPHLHLEIAHVLFMDVVGYSKLLVNEQREIMQQLNQLVRKTGQFQTSEATGKLISTASKELSAPSAPHGGAQRTGRSD